MTVYPSSMSSRSINVCVCTMEPVQQCVSPTVYLATPYSLTHDYAITYLFSESRRNRPNSHVQFAVDTNLDTGLIQLEPMEGGMMEAHIGMLKSHHTYSAAIPVTHSLGQTYFPIPHVHACKNSSIHTCPLYFVFCTPNVHCEVCLLSICSSQSYAPCIHV